MKETIIKHLSHYHCFGTLNLCEVVLSFAEAQAKEVFVDLLTSNIDFVSLMILSFQYKKELNEKYLLVATACLCK